MTEPLGERLATELRCTAIVLAVMAKGVAIVGFGTVVGFVDGGLGLMTVEVVAGLIIIGVGEVVIDLPIMVDVVSIKTSFVVGVSRLDIVAFKVVVEFVPTTVRVCASAVDTDVLIFAIVVIIVVRVGDAARAFIVGVAIMMFCGPNAASGQRQLQSHAPPGCIVPVPWTMAANAAWVGLLAVSVETRLALLVLARARAGVCKGQHTVIISLQQKRHTVTVTI
jgi:hypothetical protein